jgi:hypothetical protein
MKPSDTEFLPLLTEKDIREIKKCFEKEVLRIHSKTDLCVEAKESLLCSLHFSIYLSKRMAKKKFTPKKYRYWENAV